jgi:hypothetical protein
MRPELLALLLLMGGCLCMGCGSNATGSECGKEFKTTGSLEQNVDNVSRLQLSGEIGNVEIKPVSTPTLKAVIEKVVRYGTKELAEELFEKVKVTARNDGNTVFIETAGLEEVKAIIAKYRALVDPAKVSLEINYILEVPTNLSQFKIATRVGNIALTDLTGVFDLTTDIGNIALKNRMALAGKSSVRVNTGNIEARIQEIQSTAGFEGETQNGNITLLISDAISCTVELEQYMQEKRIINHNGGGVPINAKAVLGTVNCDFY